MTGTSGGGDGTTAAAVHAALRTVAAIVRRDRTGEGAFLDAAGADAVIAQGWIGAVYGWNERRLTDRTGLRPAGAGRSAVPATSTTRPPTTGSCCSARSSRSSGSASARPSIDPISIDPDAGDGVAGRLRPRRRAAPAQAAGGLRRPAPNRRGSSWRSRTTSRSGRPIRACGVARRRAPRRHGRSSSTASTPSPGRSRTSAHP